MSKVGENISSILLLGTMVLPIVSGPICNIMDAATRCCLCHKFHIVSCDSTCHMKQRQFLSQSISQLYIGQVTWDSYCAPYGKYCIGLLAISRAARNWA